MVPCSLILKLLCQLTQDLNSKAPLNGCPRAAGWLLVVALGTASLSIGSPSLCLNHRWAPRLPRMFVCPQEDLNSFSSGLILQVSFLPPAGEGRKLSRWPHRPRQPCQPEVAGTRTVESPHSAGPHGQPSEPCYCVHAACPCCVWGWFP